jgi:hypothetical protein
LIIEGRRNISSEASLSANQNPRQRVFYFEECANLFAGIRRNKKLICAADRVLIEASPHADHERNE